MTNNNLFLKLKNKIAIVLAVLFVFCMSVFCLTACNNDKDESTTKPSFSFTNPEDGKIANGLFVNDTATKKLDAYPIVSASSWTKKYHESAVSSYVDSGVIDVSKTPWDTLSKKLKADGDLINALVAVHNDEIVNELKTRVENPISNPTTDDVKNYIKDNFDTIYFKNPGYHDGATESKMYMLNNYSQSEQYKIKGTAQTVTSSTTVTVEAGSIGKLTFWVKTANICGPNHPDNQGANVRLTNTLNGVTQNEYRITAIKDTEWTQYTLYLFGDTDYASTFILSFGLGLGQGSSTASNYYTQGTAFFDDIVYEEVESVDDNVVNQITTNGNYKKLDLLSKKAYTVIANDYKTYAFETSIDSPVNFFDQLTSSNLVGLESDDDYFTYSNVTGQSDKKINSKHFVANSYVSVDKSVANKAEVTLYKSSASLKLTDDSFVLNSKEYALVSFRIKNQLKVQGTQSIEIDVYDVYGNEIEKNANLVTISEVSEDEVLYTIEIKNNFASVNGREFYIAIVIGPSSFANLSYHSNLSSGKVTISDIKINKGTLDEENVNFNEDLDTYRSFYAQNANASISLFAGYAKDYEEVKDEVENYGLSTKPSDFGTIINYPANVKGYEGIVSNHIYVVEDLNDSAEKKVNTRSGKGDNGSYAGLINTKFFNNYDTAQTGLDIENNIGTVNENIQPIMIYNKVADNYGFIGEKQTIEANSYALFSVDVRVTDNAVAYIYIVDVSLVDKSVMSMGSFAKADTLDGFSQGTVDENTKLELALRIDATTLSEEDEEWVTVNFYVATGNTAKDVRLEMWNGSRSSAQEKSQGYVFFNNVSVKLLDAFAETDAYYKVTADSKHPLFNVIPTIAQNQNNQLLAYKRPLTDKEKEFNVEYPDQAVSYEANYVWAKTNTLVYAVLNTIDPLEIDPYDDIEEEDRGAGCTLNTDPSTFWLNFSSILLGVCLVVAIVMLIIKRTVSKRKANKNDAVSHYKVTSRIKSDKSKKEKVENEDNSQEDEVQSEDELDEQPLEEQQPEDQSEDEQQPETLDEYVYGDVQDFGSDEQNDSQDDNQPNE